MKVDNYILKRINVNIAYKPTGAFIDNRGKLLEVVGPEKWTYRRYEYDRLFYEDKNNLNKCVLTWKRAIFSMEDVPNFGCFCDHIRNKLPKKLWDTMNVYKFDWIKFNVYLLYPTQEPFKKLVSQLRPLLNVEDEILKKIEIPFSDIGFPIRFENKRVRVQITFGPMEKEQMNLFFEERDALPERAIFVEIEYIIKANRVETVNLKTISQEVVDFVKDRAIPFIKDIYRKCDPEGRGEIGSFGTSRTR